MDGEVTQLLTVRIDITNTGQALDSKDITLSRNGAEEDRLENISVGRGKSISTTLNWQTEVGDVGDWEIEVSTPDDTDVLEVSLFAPLEIFGGETIQASESNDVYSAIRFEKGSALQYQNDNGVTVRTLQ